MPLLILVTLLPLKKPDSLLTERPTFGFISYSRTRLQNDCVLCCCLVPQSCLTPCDPRDCSLPDPFVHVISQTRTLEGLSLPSAVDLPDAGIKPTSPALAGGCFTTKPPGKPDCVLSCTYERFISQGASECVCVCVHIHMIYAC